MIDSHAESPACYFDPLINRSWLNADLLSADPFVVIGNLIIPLKCVRSNSLQQSHYIGWKRLVEILPCSIAENDQIFVGHWLRPFAWWKIRGPIALIQEWEGWNDELSPPRSEISWINAEAS
jgi:hypothetical protein